MLDTTQLFNQSRFPWPLAIKLAKEATAYTLGLWFVFGIFALALEVTYEFTGLPGVLLLLAAIGVGYALSENARALWALVLPVFERKLASHRARLGL